MTWGFHKGSSSKGHNFLLHHSLFSSDLGQTKQSNTLQIIFCQSWFLFQVSHYFIQTVSWKKSLKKVSKKPVVQFWETKMRWKTLHRLKNLCTNMKTCSLHLFKNCQKNVPLAAVSGSGWTGRACLSCRLYFNCIVSQQAVLSPSIFKETHCCLDFDSIIKKSQVEEMVCKE